MADTLYDSRSPFVRYLASLVPFLLALVLMVGTFFLVMLVSNRFEGLGGAFVGVVAGASVGLGIWLAYLILVDAINLRLIRRSCDAGLEAMRDGQVVAFEGTVRVDGAPMVAPFSQTACAAYVYRIVATVSRGERRTGFAVKRDIGQGFHMMRTRIEGASRSLRLASFPGFETDLRENATGGKWNDEAVALVASIQAHADTGNDRARLGRLMEFKHSHTEEAHADYLVGPIGKDAGRLVIDEEVLPAGQRVCVIGTYEEALQALTARRSRLGDNLMVYRGSAQEVLQRVGRETVMYAKLALGMIAAGALIVGYAVMTAA